MKQQTLTTHPMPLPHPPQAVGRKAGFAVCLAAWGAVWGAVALASVTAVSAAPGTPATREAQEPEPPSDAPSLLLSWLAKVTDIALCDQALRVAVELNDDPGAQPQIGCATGRPGAPVAPVAPVAQQPAQAAPRDDDGLRLADGVRAYTGMALRQDIARCLREAGAAGATPVVATDGVDRFLVTRDGRLQMMQVATPRCRVLQAWSPPADKPRATQAQFVKGGAYVIVTDTLPGYDDTARLFFLADGRADLVTDYAWRLDGRPQLRDARTALVVGSSMRIVQNRRDTRLTQHPPPLLGITYVDGPKVVKAYGYFQLSFDEQVLVRANQDSSLVAVARLGGLVSSVLLVGPKACQAELQLVGHRSHTATEEPVTPPLNRTTCSLAAFKLPHQ